MVSNPQRKPSWLKVSSFAGPGYVRISRLLKERNLNTVCQAANCPNRGECFNRGTATFLILGPVCSRNCRFCDVPTGQPRPIDPDEPVRVAEVAAELELRHVVITSVTRDDLADGGAIQFARTVSEIKKRLPGSSIEVLTPDFRQNMKALDLVISSRPDVFNHNLETVERLYSIVRDLADYRHSLRLLQYVADTSGIVAKTGLMVGLGETRGELEYSFSDIAETGVSILTIGQYLSPSVMHLPVTRYLHPEEFDSLARLAESAGIRKVIAGPLVRSSYMADMVSPPY